MFKSLAMAALPISLLGAGLPESRIVVTLPPALADDASGRLLVFAEPATPSNATADNVDSDGPSSSVSIAGRDVAGFGGSRSVNLDIDDQAYPTPLSALKPGEYRVQVVLDRDGDYNYGGRRAGDLVSKVVTLQLPLITAPAIALDHALPSDAAQFDLTGISPTAVVQINAARPNLHEEVMPSPALTRFAASERSIRAWVLTPPGYDPTARRTYPTVYTAGGFGATHRLDGLQLSRQWHLMETGVIPPMIWVTLDYATPNGTTEFADSVNNGPWGQTLVGEVIPYLERRYRMDAEPSSRFLTGHSSGGWFALWAMVRYPKMFGGSWATSPDPVDFHDFLGVDLYAARANIYRDASGAPRPLERANGSVRATIEQLARREIVVGGNGGQLRSFEWTFSPRRIDGAPAPMFNRQTGAVDPEVVAHWGSNYDIGARIRSDWPRIGKKLDGKIHVVVGTDDSFYLDGSVRRLEADIASVGGHAEFTYVPGASHSMSAVYASGTDRNALWRSMTSAMCIVARPKGNGCTAPQYVAGSKGAR